MAKFRLGERRERGFMKTIRSLVVLSLVSVLGIVVGANDLASAQTSTKWVRAVEDITGKADCEISERTHADADRTILIDEQVLTCPAGSVLHTSTMTEQEAQQRELRYVMLTGDTQADIKKVDDLKREMGPDRTPTDLSPGRASMLNCMTLYRQRSIGYSGGTDPGGYIRTWVYYEQLSSDCGNVHVTDSSIVFEQAPNAGADLYWDEQRAGGTARDTGCKTVLYLTSTWHTHSPTWSVAVDSWLTDESINDTSFGCSWWGEEFTGSVQLTL
jgi:hypothetical protein